MSVTRVLALLVAAALVAAAPARVGAAGACAAERFSKNRVYAACTDLPTLGASVHWTYDPAASSLSVAFVAAPPSSGGWVAWGLNPSGDGMSGTQALVASPTGSGGAYGVQTFDIQGTSLGSPGPIAYKTSDLAAEVGADGRVQMFGKLALQNGTGEVNQVWQVGPASGGSIGIHAMAAANMGAKGKLNLVTGATTAVSGGSILRKKNTHGILNAVSWGILLPMGGIVARYLKTFKSADPAWFYLHVACQLIGYAVGVSGWATGIHLGNLSKGITYSLHRNIGIAVFALGTVQIFALFLRPKKDHKLRVYWNVYHHSVGYTIIILGIVNIFKGMSILDVAQKWKTGYIIAIGILGGVAVALEVITWAIVLKRRKTEDKAYNGGASNNNNGHLPM
ncbi:cytochrome b561 and DOMON domain-containing protein At4g12980-like [Triticum urartu]|uniref:Cytochrome b561 and DOMON domain-containing protein n=1 Tax=Triticum urartu TaxID=4572 RepID=A0A8R7V187_TRIUA|nr:cytochrome b561 and DOMON domain-containing protein At4g12980-like [Triticum dicoccoides]XP_048541041.1 cytochrome b561 and DOMON domain-containing protein At4g12980-like [Triticum urartu]